MVTKAISMYFKRLGREYQERLNPVLIRRGRLSYNRIYKMHTNSVYRQCLIVWIVRMRLLRACMYKFTNVHNVYKFSGNFFLHKGLSARVYWEQCWLYCPTAGGRNGPQYLFFTVLGWISLSLSEPSAPLDCVWVCVAGFESLSCGFTLFPGYLSGCMTGPTRLMSNDQEQHDDIINSILWPVYF